MKSISLFSLFLTTLCLAVGHYEDAETIQPDARRLVRPGVMAPLGDAEIYRCHPVPQDAIFPISITLIKEKNGDFRLEQVNSIFEVTKDENGEMKPVREVKSVKETYLVTELKKQQLDKPRTYSSEFLEEFDKQGRKFFSKKELLVDKSHPESNEAINAHVVVSTKRGGSPAKVSKTQIDLHCNRIIH